MRKARRKPSPKGWRAPVDLFTDRKDLPKVFTTIYDRAVWGHGSGSGSSPKNLADYTRFFSAFLKEHQIRSVVDLGCGDWQFSQFIDWSGIKYLGIDVVESVIMRNTERFSNPTVTFKSVNIFEHPEKVPSADLLVVKDVLQHLSNANVFRILAFAKKFRYAIITNDYAKENIDCENGDTRPLDIRKPPFAVTNAILALRYAGKAAFVLVNRAEP